MRPLERLVELAASGRLYPSVILHGGDREARLAAASRLAQAVLCEAPPLERPCGHCRHCARVGLGGERFHPDLHALGRDLKTATSVAAARGLLAEVHLAPYEARGQVFVLLEAESLSPEAGDALLKVIEEPPTRAPRNFLLLAPSPRDVVATLRSRSWSLYLGPAERLPAEEIAASAVELASAARAFAASSSGLHLLEIARVLVAGGGEQWRDVRAGRPWLIAASTAGRAAAELADPRLRRRLLGLATDLLEAQPWRLRGISAERIVEGLVARRFSEALADPLTSGGLV